MSITPRTERDHRHHGDPTVQISRGSTSGTRPRAAPPRAERDRFGSGVSMKRYEAAATAIVRMHGEDELAERQLVAGDPSDHLVDRPVVQVQPVRAQIRSTRAALLPSTPVRPSTPRWVIAAITTNVATLVRNSPPRNRNGSAPARRGEIGVPAHPADEHEADDGEHVEHPTLGAQRTTHDRPRPPHHRECRAEHDAAEPGDRAQVEGVDLADRPVADPPVRLGRDGRIARRPGVEQHRHDRP